VWGFIAVYDFASRRISYVNPSYASDSAPLWSTNGDRISYIRRAEGIADQRLTSPVPHASVRAGALPPLGERSSLEAMLAAPILYQPATSADGRSIAFVAREGKERAIYFARVGQKARRVAEYNDDDGQELKQVALSRDGSLLAYQRGGPVNAEGQVPNPRSLPEEPQSQVWLLDTSGATPPRLLGIGNSPQFSPDDRRVLWSSDRGVMNALLVQRSTTRSVGPAELLLSGPASRLRFSPSGDRIAYERSGNVEIFDLENGALWSVSRPATASDGRPVWAPDGKSIGFIRLSGPQPALTGSGYAGEVVAKEPWSIWTADVESHGSKQIWKAASGMGSAFYPLDEDATGSGKQGDQLFWSVSGHIAFVWERDGWRHLYSVPETGGEARLLTPGEGEVEAAELSTDGKHIVYSTNIGDLDRRHIASVAAGGGKVRKLTGGRFSQWGATPLADGALGYIEAGWANPAAVMLRNSSGKTISAGGPSLPPGYPASAMVEPQAVQFPGTDGRLAYGQLFVPSKPNGCGIIFVHGGIRRQMLLGFHYKDVYSNLYELNQYFASRGCAVLSVEYRSSIMRGYEFRNAPGWGDAGASEYLDVLGGANYLKSRPELGVRKIGIHGLSWGGYITAQALARNSDLFSAGLDMAGVHEFLGNGFKHSPAAFVEQWRSPVFLAFGDDDRNVDFNQGIQLANALRVKQPDLEVVTHVIPNETHDMYLTFENLVSLYQAGGDFLLQKLTR
jgi:dipeptidyl aminopeptidase/acylaminoacyl peptidase